MHEGEFRTCGADIIPLFRAKKRGPPRVALRFCAVIAIPPLVVRGFLRLGRSLGGILLALSRHECVTLGTSSSRAGAGWDETADDDVLLVVPSSAYRLAVDGGLGSTRVVSETLPARRTTCLQAGLGDTEQNRMAGRALARGLHA